MPSAPMVAARTPLLRGISSHLRGMRGIPGAPRPSAPPAHPPAASHAAAAAAAAAAASPLLLRSPAISQPLCLSPPPRSRPTAPSSLRVVATSAGPSSGASPGGGGARLISTSERGGRRISKIPVLAGILPAIPGRTDSSSPRGALPLQDPTSSRAPWMLSPRRSFSLGFQPPFQHARFPRPSDASPGGAPRAKP